MNIDIAAKSAMRNKLLLSWQESQNKQALKRPETVITKTKDRSKQDNPKVARLLKIFYQIN